MTSISEWMLKKFIVKLGKLAVAVLRQEETAPTKEEQEEKSVTPPRKPVPTTKKKVKNAT